jgi:hypothetical protein
MPNIKISGKDQQERREYVYGFPKGVNKLQDESLINDQELSLMQNGILVVDGIEKRAGTLNYGDTSQSRVYAASPFYTSSNDRFIIREMGTSLGYYNGSGTPIAISGATITAATRAEFAMARDTLYYVNPTDAMVKIAVSGGVPVATTFTAITTPTGLAISNQGASGTTAYSYRVSAYNAVGETLACISVATTTGNATLTTSNFNRLTWDAVANAVGYVVYGRENTAHNGIGETQLNTVVTNTYDDTGVDTPSTTITPGDGNSTGGQKGSMIIYAMGRLFISGDTANPSRVYYGGAANQIDDFSTAYSGGNFDVSKNDGTKITAIFFYQNAVIIWKEKSIWKFTFTDAGLPKLELITNEVGCCSFRTVKIVNNDLWFTAIKDGRLAVYSVGNVQNYFNALRTTEKSLNVSNGAHLDSANLAYAQYATGYYFRNLYLLSVPQGASTTNNYIYPYDTRFSAWLGQWTGINAGQFFTYDDSTGEQLYHCSETTGYVVKMFTGTDDNGTAVAWKVQTKNFNQKLFDQYKIYRNPTFWFKDVSNGAVTGYIINDGLFNSGTFSVSSAVSGISWGYDRWGAIKWGTSSGSAGTSVNSDQPMEIIFTKIARSQKFELDENSSSGSFKFLGLSYRWTLLSGKPLPGSNRIRLTA